MTVINNLEVVADWLRLNVCEKLTFKKPDDDKVGDSYKYALVHPDVHIMYAPTKDMMPKNRHVSPSIIVQFDTQKEYAKSHNGLIYFKLGFTTWNPGIHDNGKYERNVEGWRDVWNFVECTKEAIKNTEFINHIRVRLEDGIECGPIKEQGAIADFYPYWFAYLCFTGEFGVATNHKKYSHLL